MARISILGNVRQTGLAGYYDKWGVPINYPLAEGFDPTYPSRYSDNYDYMVKKRSEVYDILSRYNDSPEEAAKELAAWKLEQTND